VLTLAVTTVISARWIFKRVFAAYQKARAEEIQREETTQRDLRNAFEKIVPPKNDVMTRSGAMLGLVSADYKSTLSWEEIKSHYSEQFVRQGWRYLLEDPIIYDGHDYGGKEIIYCKPPYAAALQYAGRQESKFGFTYGLSFSSDLHEKCQR
jgi:hypothetical protein